MKKNRGTKFKGTSSFCPTAHHDSTEKSAGTRTLRIKSVFHGAATSEHEAKTGPLETPAVRRVCAALRFLLEKLLLWLSLFIFSAFLFMCPVRSLIFKSANILIYWKSLVENTLK